MSGFPVFAEVKSVLPARRVLEHYLGPARFRRFLCPFHPDKNPSMTEKDGGIVCWACGWRGDIYKFIVEYQGVSIADALRILADMAGVILPNRDERKPPRHPAIVATMERIRRESKQVGRDIFDQAKRAAAQAWREAWDERHDGHVWDIVAIGAALNHEVELLRMNNMLSPWGTP